MNQMVDNPPDYFRQWVAERSHLLCKLELEAEAQGIPIVGPVVGRLLHLLARVIRAGRILELGTATGYSAIFMGAACRIQQGHIVSFEIDPEMASRARENITAAGLDDLVDIRCQDVMLALPKLDQPVDMVFMDVEKQDYVKLLPLCGKLLRTNGLLVADNTGFKDAHGFNQAIHEDPGWISVNLWAMLPGHSPEQDGICLAAKT